MIVYQIIDYVVTLLAFCVVLFCVIDHVIGAQRLHEIDIARATDAGDFRAK